MIRLLALLTLLASPLVAENRAPTLAPEVLEFTQGAFCAPQVVDMRDAPDTSRGTVGITESHPPYLWEGGTVPVRLGLAFDIRFRLSPEVTGPLSIVGEHPPIGPRGLTRSSHTSPISSNGEKSTGFTFDFADELVTGPWTLIVLDQGRELIRAHFTLVPADTVPGALTACPGPDLMS